MSLNFYSNSCALKKLKLQKGPAIWDKGNIITFCQILCVTTAEHSSPRLGLDNV